MNYKLFVYILISVSFFAYSCKSKKQLTKTTQTEKRDSVASNKIPDTKKAMQDCINKVKKGGHFYVYLYYNLDKRGFLFKQLFKLSDVLRSIVSKFPGTLKKIVCDILAVLIYMPLILWVRFLIFIGLQKVAKQMPLSNYKNKSFFNIRSDALDRFGTRLEQRFSEKEVKNMMLYCGLTDIFISPSAPYYHAIGKKL